MLKTAIRLTLIAAIVAGILLVGWFWYRFYEDQTETYTVTRGHVSGVIISGTLRCRQRTHVRSEVQATVARWHVKEGDSVQANDILVALDDSLVAEDCARAQAQVEQATSRLEELQAGPRPDEIESLRQAEKKALAAYNHAVREYDRYKEARGGTTAWEIESYKTAALIAKAELEEVRSRLRLLEQGTRPEQIAQAKAQLDLARAQLKRAEALRAKFTVRAPHKGKVTKTFPHTGEMVTPTASLLLLHNFESLEIDGHAQESLQSRIAPDDKALVRPDANSAIELSATVKQILPRVEEQRGTMTVKLGFDEVPEITLPDGGTVDIVLVGDLRTDVLRVPVEAVKGAGEKSFVWLERDGDFVQQPVKVGRDDGHYIEILDGLEPGQVIRKN